MALVMMMMCTVPAFAVEMSDEVCASSTSNDFNETIHMTDEQALEYFKAFLASQPSVATDENYITQESLNAFAQYAVR